jgi:hypothetical protein
MATSNQDRIERAELERERNDDQISPAQPLGPDRIDDDEGRRSVDPAEAPKTKSDDRVRMQH